MNDLFDYGRAMALLPNPLEQLERHLQGIQRVLSSEYKDRQQDIHTKLVGQRPISPREKIASLESRRHSARLRSIGGLSFDIPAPVIPLWRELQTSRRILDMPANWDGEGSQAYSVVTWQRAIQFVLRMAIESWRMSDIVAPLPALTPGPEGSLDVTWRTSKRALFLNVPAEESEPIEYFGRDHSRTVRVKGEERDESHTGWMLSWLMNS